MVSYLNSAWTPTAGCLACNRNKMDVSKVEKLPTLYMTLMVEETTPFLHHWFKRLDALSYPKDKLTVFVHNQVSCVVFIIVITLLLNYNFQVLYYFLIILVVSTGLLVKRFFSINCWFLFFLQCIGTIISSCPTFYYYDILWCQVQF